jgi:hypothetical protein
MSRNTLVLVLFCTSLNAAAAQSLAPSGFEAWPVPIEKRVFPGSFSRKAASRAIRLVVAATKSFQLSSRHGTTGHPG